MEFEEEKENSFVKNDLELPVSEVKEGSYGGMDLPEGNSTSPPNSARSTLSR